MEADDQSARCAMRTLSSSGWTRGQALLWIALSLDQTTHRYRICRWDVLNWNYTARYLPKRDGFYHDEKQLLGNGSARRLIAEMDDRQGIWPQCGSCYFWSVWLF